MMTDLEDRLGADVNKLSDELNADLQQFKKEREQERETRTAQLVEAQQSTEADTLTVSAPEDSAAALPNAQALTAAWTGTTAVGRTMLWTSRSSSAEACPDTWTIALLLWTTCAPQRASPLITRKTAFSLPGMSDEASTTVSPGSMVMCR